MARQVDSEKMKALILAAGLGTRLRPHTLYTPKPLFTIDGAPLLDLLIRRLIGAGCEAVAVNTHHLHEASRNISRKPPTPSRSLPGMNRKSWEQGGPSKIYPTSGTMPPSWW